MDTLCVNNITVYPGVIPPKPIILKELIINYNETEFIKIWLSKCKNIFYSSTPRHPIYNYNLNNPKFILCHLFYLLKSGDFFQNDIELDIINKFLNGVIIYLRVNSGNCYQESMMDPIVKMFYLENYLPIEISPFGLSYLKAKISDIKIKNILLKENTKKSLSLFKIDFESMSKKINSLFVNLPKKKMNFSTQTDKNVWQNKNVSPIHISSADFVTGNKQICKNKQVQTYIPIRNIETQTDFIPEKETIIVEVPQKKKNDAFMEFTEKQYKTLLKEHADSLDKSFKEGFDKCKKEEFEFLKTDKISFKQFAKISSVIDEYDVRRTAIAWSIFHTSNQFREVFKNPIISFDHQVRSPKFYEFWTNVVMPSISKMEHKLFQLLKYEWEQLNKIIKDSGYPLEPIHIDISFGIYSTMIIDCKWEKIILVPPFFMLLLMNCRNILILLAIIDIWHKEKERPHIKKCLLRDFEVLLTLPNEKEILERNRKFIQIDKEALEVIFDIRGQYAIEQAVV